MKRVIKAFEKFPAAIQEDIYGNYLDGDLDKATFPFKGEIADGVLYVDEKNECIYLIPIQTIKASHMSLSGDDDDDDDFDDNDDNMIIDDNDNDEEEDE